MNARTICTQKALYLFIFCFPFDTLARMNSNLVSHKYQYKRHANTIQLTGTLPFLLQFLPFDWINRRKKKINTNHFTYPHYFSAESIFNISMQIVTRTQWTENQTDQMKQEYSLRFHLYVMYVICVCLVFFSLLLFSTTTWNVGWMSLPFRQ